MPLQTLNHRSIPRRLHHGRDEPLRATEAVPLPDVRTALACELDQAGSTPVSVLALGFDAFADTITGLGTSAAEIVLGELMRRTLTLLRPGQWIGHVNGAELALILPDTTRRQARALAGRIQTVARQPLIIKDVILHPNLRIGISTRSSDADTGPAIDGAAAAADELLDRAVLALAAAGRGTPGLALGCEVALAAAAHRRLVLQADLRDAVETGALHVVYQPQMDLRTGGVRAMEALLRWTHPELGVIAPAEFIELAEASGLMPALGKWVLVTACTEAARWSSPTISRVGLSVNVSGRQLDEAAIVPTVKRALALSGLPACALTLEITESVLTGDPVAAGVRLRALAALGVRISLDDFGTGYCSLEALTRFPVDEIKIDRAFVAAVPGDRKALQIITAIMALATSLNLTTVAEGIETGSQERILRALSCTLGQGYRFSRPLSAENVAAILAPARDRHIG